MAARIRFLHKASHFLPCQILTPLAHAGFVAGPQLPSLSGLDTRATFAAENRATDIRIIWDDGAQGQNRTADTRIFNRTGQLAALSHRIAVCARTNCDTNDLAARDVPSLPA